MTSLPASPAIVSSPSPRCVSLSAPPLTVSIPPRPGSHHFPVAVNGVAVTAADQRVVAALPVMVIGLLTAAPLKVSLPPLPVYSTRCTEPNSQLPSA